MTRDGARPLTPLSKTRRRWFRAVVVGLILLGGTEAVLQAAHAYAGRSAMRSSLTDPGAPVILCLGDSHAFGVGVEESETYPARLEQLIRASGRRVNVVNLGAPGMNTSEIRRRLPAELELYRPLAVIVLAGVNDGWNRRDVWWADREDGLSTSLGDRLGGWISSRVMLARAAQVLAHRLDWTRPAEETSRDREGRMIIHHRLEAWKVESAQDSYDRARRNLAAVVSQVRAARAVPVLMTYVTDPEFTFESPSRLLRELSIRMKVTLADNDRSLHDVMFKDGKLIPAQRQRLFFPDMHPSQEGYKLLAANVLRSLQESGVIDYLPKTIDK